MRKLTLSILCLLLSSCNSQLSEPSIDFSESLSSELSSESSNEISSSEIGWFHTEIDQVKLYSEEELIEMSDVIIVINNALCEEILYEEKRFPLTKYSINVVDVIKGEFNLSYIYLFGNTTKDSKFTTNLDETIENDQTYKIYLKIETESIYTTTVPSQSIYLVE